MRTTVDIDEPILREVKELGRSEGKSLGRVVSDLLAEALEARSTGAVPPPPRPWIAKAMGARVDLGDRDAVYAAMERAKISRPARGAGGEEGGETGEDAP